MEIPGINVMCNLFWQCIFILLTYDKCVPRPISTFYSLTEVNTLSGWIANNVSASQIGLVNEYPTMHYFGNPRHTQSMITYDFDRIFLEIPVKYCIVGMLLTCHIVFNISRPRRNGYCYVFVVQRHQYCIPADIACSRTCNSGYQQQFPDQTSPWWLYIWPSQLECCVHMARLPSFDLQVGK